jgi:protein-disulfide isomerase
MTRLGFVVFLCCGSLALTACGNDGGGLSASSSCRDFAEAKPEEQAEAISKLATEFRTPELTTPLGEPAVAYACASEPDATLEAVFGQAGQGGLAQTEIGRSPTSSLSGVEEVEELLGELPQEQMSLGQGSAAVDLVMFSDPLSANAKTYIEENVNQMIYGVVGNGEARIEYRPFLIISPDSVEVAAAAMAAGEQGNGWSFLEVLNRNLRQNAVENAAPKFLTEVAEAAGVEDISRWGEERMSSALERRAEETTKEAEELELLGTPSFAVEGPGTKGLELIGTPAGHVELEEAVERAEG